MNKYYILGAILLITGLVFFILFVKSYNKCPEHAVEPLHLAYCKHSGYEGKATHNETYCIFDDNTSCRSYEFYNGSCGLDKHIEIPPRKLCEDVYVEFEQCEEGLKPTIPRYLLDQPYCEKE